MGAQERQQGQGEAREDAMAGGSPALAMATLAIAMVSHGDGVSFLTVKGGLSAPSGSGWFVGRDFHVAWLRCRSEGARYWPIPSVMGCQGPAVCHVVCLCGDHLKYIWCPQMNIFIPIINVDCGYYIEWIAWTFQLEWSMCL